MNIYQQFQTNADLERNGIFLEYGPNSKGQPMRVLVARAGGANMPFIKAMENKFRPYRRQVQTETMDPALMEKLLHEVYAETIVLDWENWEDGDNKDLPFSRENCIKLFKDLPDFYRDIVEQCQRIALYRSVILEPDAKN